MNTMTLTVKNLRPEMQKPNKPLTATGTKFVAYLSQSPMLFKHEMNNLLTDYEEQTEK